jgi:hypothetical protein
MTETVLNDVPETLTLTVPVTPAMTQGIKAVGAAAEAEAWEIDSNEMAQLAADQRKSWAKRIDQVKALEKDFMEPAKTFMASIKEKCEKWFAPALTDLENGRTILGNKMLSWDAKERARIDAERRRIEEEQRKIRQEAERKAAEARAKAEQQAQEKRRQEMEAQAAQEKAIREGNAKAAAEAAQAAAKAREQAAAVEENAAAAARKVEQEAAARVNAFEAPVAVKIEGSTVRENWVAVLEPGYDEDMALLAICNAIITNNRRDLLALLKIDTAPRGALNKLASAQKKLMTVPGYVAQNIGGLAGARK